MIVWPDKFKNDVRINNKVLLIEPPKGYHNDCENCGGLGEMFAFYASRGPFIHVPPHDKDEILKSVDDPIYGWFWFVGRTFSESCPKCHGIGKRDPITKPMKLESVPA